jgi:hypothetical protein
MIDPLIAISAVSIKEELTYLEFDHEQLHSVIHFLQHRKMIFNLDIVSSDVKRFIWHLLAWKFSDCFNSFSYGVLILPPYIQRPIRILDISRHGKATVLVLPEEKHDCFGGSLQKVAVGYGDNEIFIDCTVWKRNKTFNGFPLIEVPIETVYVKVLLDLETRNIFEKNIPPIRPSFSFSFITETLKEHEDLLRGDAEDSVNDSNSESYDEFVLSSCQKDKKFKRIKESTTSDEESSDSQSKDYIVPDPISDESEGPLNLDGQETSKSIESADPLDFNESESPSFPDFKESESEGSSDSNESKSEQSSDDDVLPPAVLYSPKSSAIWQSKRKYTSRYNDPNWPEVAAILIEAAKSKSRKSWKDLAIKIGGGHPICTLKQWYRRLKENENYKPEAKLCGVKKQSTHKIGRRQSLENHIVSFFGKEVIIY